MLMLLPFRRTLDYSGRSSKKEFFAFFWVFLFAIPVGFAVIYPATQDFDSSRGSSDWVLIGVAIYMLLVVIPAISLFVRRLHDSGFSGWWALFLLFPGFGAAVMVAMAAWFAGTPGSNRFGPVPRS